MKRKNHFSIGNTIFYMDWLPTPHDYYQSQFPTYKVTAHDWVSVPCCFHQDRNPSLRIHLISGGFRCFACGAHGGNIIAFHSQRYGLNFQETMKSLGAWR